MPPRITVVGDSSSSGIGWGRACYPWQLHGLLAAEGAVETVNCATPGFTSADANRFVRAELAAGRSDCLIVYLGNNEGAVGGPKGRYDPLVTAVRERLFGQPQRRFAPVLSPPRARFQDTVRPPVLATTPREFAANLRAIVGAARRRATPVVLVNPIANAAFPSGLGTPNTSYFCYLDGLGQLGDAPDNDPIEPASAALAEGLTQFARGEHARAVACWQPLAARDDLAGFVARHNIACAGLHLGAADCVEDLRALVGRHDRYDSLVLYNLAHMMRARGAAAEAERLLAQALEQDFSVYRIRRAYRAVVAAFAGRRGVDVLDLDGLLTPHDFVDYCHPTAAGHAKIAAALAPLVRRHLRAAAAGEGASYRVRLPSPNHLTTPRQDLYDYYCIDWPIAPARIAAALGAVAARPIDGAQAPSDDVERCVSNFLRVNADHPAFTSNLRFDGAGLPRSHEILTCPENYLYRLMHNYAAAFEAGAMAATLTTSPALATVRLSSDDYRRMILHPTQTDLAMPLDIRPEYHRAVLDKLIDRLRSAEHLFRVTIGRRVRTLMTWYTREVFRYGTHSRLSMLYPRMDIERLVEGAIVAVVIAVTLGQARDVARLDALLAEVLGLIDVHERHVGLYHVQDPGFSPGAYQAELDLARRRIDAGCSGLVAA